MSAGGLEVSKAEVEEDEGDGVGDGKSNRDWSGATVVLTTDDIGASVKTAAAVLSSFANWSWKTELSWTQLIWHCWPSSITRRCVRVWRSVIIVSGENVEEAPEGVENSIMATEE